MKLILALLGSVNLFTLAFSQQYTQYNMHSEGQCSGQPIYMISNQNGACQIQGTPKSQCNAVGDPNSIYQSQKTICSSDPLNLSGIVQWYVSKSSWMTSGKCEGNPFQVEAMVADALCHPAQSKDGVITSYFSVNCNGGRPIYKSCKDAGCSDCTDNQESGECEMMGAGSSRLVQCIKPSTNIKGIYNGDDDESHDQKLLVSGVTLASVGAAMFL